VRHQGTPKYPSSLRFLTNWEGYSADENTWESWSNKSLKSNTVIHEYLRAHNMQQLIPKRYRLDDDEESSINVETLPIPAQIESSE
jgi:hypothetical protein